MYGQTNLSFEGNLNLQLDNPKELNKLYLTKEWIAIVQSLIDYGEKIQKEKDRLEKEKKKTE